MALNFPISASNNQKFTFANKTWRYISASNAWRIEPISGSYLDNITDVDVDSAPHNSFLTYQDSKWIGKLYTGSYSGDYFTTSSVDTDGLQPKLVFTNQGYANSNLDLPNNVNVNFVTESLVLGGITNQFIDSEGTDIFVLSSSTAITASSGELAASVEYYPSDNYISGSELTNDILYVSMSNPIILSGVDPDFVTTPQFHSSSLSKYTRLKTVLGKSPDASGDVNIALNTVLTGSLSVRPTASVDGTLWVIQNETGSRIGQNGRAFLYSEGPDDWFEVTPPTQDAADDRYALISGSTMLNNLRAADLPIASEEPAVKVLTDIQVPTKDTNLNAFYIYPSTTSTIPYNTWTDWTALDTTESNTISGSTISTDGVFTVPATGVSRMTFTAGAHIRESQNSRGTNLYIRIVKNDTDIIAVKSHAWDPRNGGRSFTNEGINISTGLIRVNPGDEFKVQLKRGWRNRNKIFAPGIGGTDLPNGSNNLARKSGGSFFCGVINDTPPGTGVTGINGGTGINVTGTDEVKTISVNSTILRTDIDYTIYTDQRITGSLEGTGSLIISGNSTSNNVIFSGSTFLTGDAEITGLGNYTSDAEAAANGVAVGKLYRNGNQIMIRIS